MGGVGWHAHQLLAHVCHDASIDREQFGRPFGW
jgi:hypothetical protein